MLASASAPIAIAAITQDRALIGLLRSTVDPTHDLILVNSEDELVPHLNSRRVSACLLDSMFIEGDLAVMAERLRDTWPDLVLVVVGTAEEQSRVASQITSGVVYRFLHRPVSAPRVRLFVEAALRRHEVENVERTLEHVRPDFSRAEAPRADTPFGGGGRSKSLVPMLGIAGVVLAALAGGAYLFSRGDTGPAAARVVSEPPPAAVTAKEPAPAPVATPAAAKPAAVKPADTTLAEQKTVAPPPVAPAPVAAPKAEPKPAPATESVADRLRPAASRPITLPEESTVPSGPVLTHEQRLKEKLSLAEAALQRGELASPPGRSAVDLFRDALELDPANSLAKGGLVRVADRLLSAAERALTAGNPEDARKMVDVAETLTPATARGAFLAMQIEMEHERAALTRTQESTDNSQQERGAKYLRLANARLKSGALIEPSEDNARFYLEAAKQISPDDPALADTTRALQKELLSRAGTAAAAGNAAETERWLANADGAGATRPDMANIRRSLQDTLIGARATKMTALAQSFTNALGANQLLQPADTSAKAYLLELIRTDAAHPTTTGARQNLGLAYQRQLRAALARGDLRDADAWLNEARTISFSSDDLNAAEAELTASREKAAAANDVVGANSLQRLEYVAPKFPASTRNRNMSGWVEIEFTVKSDGSTDDIVVTNSSPRRTFDNAAINAVREWRYKPVVRDGKAVDQRAAVRIRFADE
ncbi:MAG TPA: TonB family protein [Steroidobacteraceae bacterium]|nr:TonB family protein [Steroidobacteraceae bacterium]